MKFILWFCFLSLVAFRSATAQIIQLGVRTGVSITLAILQPMDGIREILASAAVIGSQVKLRSMGGYQAGIMMNIAGATRFSLQPEVLFSRYEVKYDAGLSAGEVLTLPK